ncbi:hypothetical protein DDQ41_12335 [Streptomyces spongiicola]|uniref:Uncharacterized protein n=1 Tax=Streptomyces spongiicola TaxID=1690221 RepID=A0ABN5KMN2_9ACTN|nr:hypothetical protein [Streptomyces spongiicola]AWK09576.1 hypothetical protein DDQ41_12335 [Streptomyces spongiicola]
MDVRDGYHLWADAHAFFDSPLIHSAPDHTDPLGQQSADWETRVAEDTPNGALLRGNALFEALTGSGPLYLLHVTHALEEISQQGFLYPSGGCLVGSIYCAPLIASGTGFRPHNLAQYVLNKEAPAFVAKMGAPERTPTPLIFEITRPRRAYRGLAGVDYLRLGSIHLSIYTHLEYLLSTAERYELRETVVSRIKNSTTFLSLAAAIVYEGADVAPAVFLELLDETIPRLPILGYLYFEALAEYLMLHSTSEPTQRLAARGEFNNWLYKEMLFATLGMAGKFDLAKFQPSPSTFAALLEQVDDTVDAAHARAYLRDRISYLVAARLFTPGQVPDAWHHTRWEFDGLAAHLGPLLGHLIHRELRTFGRYPDFYFYFDQHKALQAWNYWNHMDIFAPFNGTMPKGEVGINPAYPDLEYRVWRAEQDDAGRIHPVEQLDLTIAPRLVDIKYTLMRNNKWSVPEPSAS